MPACNLLSSLTRFGKFLIHFGIHRILMSPLFHPRNADGPIPTAKLRLDMQKAMQSDAAVFRTEQTLAEGVEKVTHIYKEFDKVGIKDRSLIWNSCVVSLISNYQTELMDV